MPLPLPPPPPSQAKAPYVFNVDLAWTDSLRQKLISMGCEIKKPIYTVFCAKKPTLTCTLYESGKLVIQGKDAIDFVTFYLEPEILGTFTVTHPTAHIDVRAHTGIDESGKGDFFGPLCIAGVFVKENQFERLHQLGVKDSKNLSDARVEQIAHQIQQECLFHVVRISPSKYNEIYGSFHNLNRLLAWGHATAIEQLVKKSGCHRVIVDQFADESLVEQALKRKGVSTDLTQRHRAEEDLAVAAASILARNAFLEGLKQLSEQVGIPLPKGASQAVFNTALQILSKKGEQQLRAVCKNHFKTLAAVLSARKL